MMVIGVKIPREKDEENREWKITPAERIHNPGSAISRCAAVIGWCLSSPRAGIQALTSWKKRAV